ncbi:N2227-like protein-domain-containing protein [Irpex lacteus]|nr:N2227-like protein-domain-containing protein [Irpex lacteus]
MPLGQAEIEEEERAFQKVVLTFQQYANYAIAANNRRRKDIYTLPRADQELLSNLGYKQKLAEVDKAILANAEFLKQIVADTQIFGGDFDEEGEDAEDQTATVRPTDADMDKLRSTIKQFVRDWSEEGKVERDVCYKPMIDALRALQGQATRSKIRVLVPAWDVAFQGFACQGNEFSHYMLLSSFFILNRSIFTLTPSVGDFEEIYGSELEDEDPEEPQSGLFDAVLTCFFIDTVSSLSILLKLFPCHIHKQYCTGEEHHQLPPSDPPQARSRGVWINLGPLLWHWENNTSNDPSIELSLDELKTLARNMERDRTTYTNNAQSMLGYVYHTAFFTATKVA